ncbi:hypothetical protein C8Q80DRAFT_280857 [Daedaleopsis nitida]|nr:hypothetical protein C8Q80DRAFT_280857 [Daedaleopsis nitida]
MISERACFDGTLISSLPMDNQVNISSLSVTDSEAPTWHGSWTTTSPSTNSRGTSPPSVPFTTLMQPFTTGVPSSTGHLVSARKIGLLLLEHSRRDILPCCSITIWRTAASCSCSNSIPIRLACGPILTRNRETLQGRLYAHRPHFIRG